MNTLAFFSAIFLLVALWQLADGKMKSGNALMIVATLIATLVNLLAGVLPFVVLNVILFFRSAYVLCKIVNKTWENRSMVNLKDLP